MNRNGSDETTRAPQRRRRTGQRDVRRGEGRGEDKGEEGEEREEIGEKKKGEERR